MTMAKSWGMETPGNIRISGTGVISQYLDDPKATANLSKMDGFIQVI